jgi:hypothetical protein
MSGARRAPEDIRQAPCRFTRQEPEFALRRDKPAGSEELDDARSEEQTSAPAPCRFTRQEPEFALRRGKPAGSEEKSKPAGSEEQVDAGSEEQVHGEPRTPLRRGAQARRSRLLCAGGGW